MKRVILLAVLLSGCASGLGIPASNLQSNVDELGKAITNLEGIVRNQDAVITEETATLKDMVAVGDGSTRQVYLWHSDKILALLNKLQEENHN